MHHVSYTVAMSKCLWLWRFAPHSFFRLQLVPAFVALLSGARARLLLSFLVRVTAERYCSRVDEIPSWFAGCNQTSLYEIMCCNKTASARRFGSGHRLCWLSYLVIQLKSYQNIEISAWESILVMWIWHSIASDVSTYTWNHVAVLQFSTRIVETFSEFLITCLLLLSTSVIADIVLITAWRHTRYIVCGNLCRTWKRTHGK